MKIGRFALPVALVALFCWSTATQAAGLIGNTQTLPQVPLVDVVGHSRTLARTDGKPLVVNLWASWCAPCRSEMPMLTQVQHDVPGIDLALVNEGEDPITVAAFLTAQGLKSDSVMVDSTMALAQSVGARAFPTTLFYDKRGMLLAVHLGPLSHAMFVQAIQTLYPEQRGFIRTSGN